MIGVRLNKRMLCMRLTDMEIALLRDEVRLSYFRVKTKDDIVLAEQKSLGIALTLEHLGLYNERNIIINLSNELRLKKNESFNVES